MVNPEASTVPLPFRRGFFFYALNAPMRAGSPGRLRASYPTTYFKYQYLTYKVIDYAWFDEKTNLPSNLKKVKKNQKVT
jgi:hypothetical protein